MGGLPTSLTSLDEGVELPTVGVVDLPLSVSVDTTGNCVAATAELVSTGGLAGAGLSSASRLESGLARTLRSSLCWLGLRRRNTSSTTSVPTSGYS